MKKFKCYALYAVATHILAVIGRIYKRVSEGFSTGRVLESMSPFETALLTSCFFDWVGYIMSIVQYPLKLEGNTLNHSYKHS